MRGHLRAADYKHIFQCNDESHYTYFAIGANIFNYEGKFPEREYESYYCILFAESVRLTMFSLQEREQSILNQYFGGKTLRQIGEEHSFTAERVRQIIAKALQRLKHRSRNRIMRYFYSLLVPYNE